MKTISARRSRSLTGGILSKLLLFIVVLFVLGAIGWVFLLPRVVVSQIHSKTGFKVTVDHMVVNPLTANVSIKGMVLKNPEDWPEDNFVDLREFRAEANLGSLFSDRMVANEVVIDVAQCTLVKNKNGQFNAKAFSDALSGTDSAAKPKTTEKKKAFLIKHLVLKFDTLVYSDYSVAKPTSKKYDLKLNRELRDVDSVAKIVNPITTASIGVLADALNSALNNNPNLLKDAASALQGVSKKTGEKLKGLLDSLEKK
jgi:uncharacterized protein involved in outer membrane biogenesis